MKLKLVDVQQEPHEVELGTCELCMSTTYMAEPSFIFKKEDGTTFYVDGYAWSWGYLKTVGEVDNIIEFADFVAHVDFKEIPERQYDEDSYEWLNELIESYYNNKEEKMEEK